MLPKHEDGELINLVTPKGVTKEIKTNIRENFGLRLRN